MNLAMHSISQCSKQLGAHGIISGGEEAVR